MATQAASAADLTVVAADHIRERFGGDPFEAFVVLGSGWAPLAAAWPVRDVVRAAEVPGFVAPAAPGHAGTIAAHDIGGHRVLVLSGRTHLYEGHGPAAVAHPVRTAAALGCGLGVLTNANGSLRPDWPVGTPLLIRDHLDLAAVSPLAGTRFVDLTDAWSPRLRTLARAAYDGELPDVVYALMRGPHYETAAEAEWVRRIGGDVLGMSTVLEAIAARAAGVELLGLSTVTAVEGGPDAIDPDEVVRIGEGTAGRLGPVVEQVLREALADGSR